MHDMILYAQFVMQSKEDEMKLNDSSVLSHIQGEETPTVDRGYFHIISCCMLFTRSICSENTSCSYVFHKLFSKIWTHEGRYGKQQFAFCSAC